MIGYYLKIVFRLIRWNKVFTFINITGLAVGMVVCILIFLWVQDEMSYDQFHTNSDRLYRIYAEFTYANQNWPVTPIPLAPAIKNKIPEIIEAVRYYPVRTLLKKNETGFNTKGAYVDPTFLKTFSFQLKNGEAQNALIEPNSIVISEEIATKIFGEEIPIGKSITLNNKTDYKISAILKDNKQNSHINFDFLLPFEDFIKKDREPENWSRFGLPTYVLLQENVQENIIEAKLTNLLNEHNPEKDINLHLQPITKIHLYKLNGGGNIEYVYIFSVTAIFILLIACINFMNLSTARSSIRMKEIGIRKVSGALRTDLIKQFFAEAVLFSLVSFIVAIIIVNLVLPFFNQFSGKSINFDLIQNLHLSLGLLGIFLFTSFIAGIYPAFYLSAFKPIKIISGSILPIFRKDSRISLRKVLVVFQFSISIFLIIATLIISRQIYYVQNKNLGFDKEHVVYLPLKGDIKNNYEAIKNELLKEKNITHIAATSGMLVDMLHSYDGFDWEGKTPDKRLSMLLAAVDPDYIQTLKMEISEGRNFSNKNPSDKTAGFILNETAIKATGLKAPIGKRFSFQARHGLREGHIIGVVKDFHFQSLRSEIEPLVMIIEPDRFNFLCLRINANVTELKPAMEFLENTWKKFVPAHPFQYSFLDQEFETMYRRDQNTRDIFSYFTFLAVFISCLGLFGLSAFTIERKTKEIGIRKVLGAPVFSLLKMLTNEFSILLIFANLIAWPIAWLIMNDWLTKFVYRIDIGWWIFFVASGLGLFIALLTISTTAIKAAIANPVESLRYE